jgi:hypothetical protein
MRKFLSVGEQKFAAALGYPVQGSSTDNPFDIGNRGLF